MPPPHDQIRPRRRPDRAVVIQIEALPPSKHGAQTTKRRHRRVHSVFPPGHVEVLAERVREGTWAQLISGDTVTEGGGEAIAEGPLWGRGRSPAQAEALRLESRILEPWSMWRDAMEHMGLSQDRRALRVQPQASSWHREESDIILNFSLEPGRYATSLLRELAVLNSPAPEYVGVDKALESQ